jgi:hypothetical protein
MAAQDKNIGTTAARRPLFLFKVLIPLPTPVKANTVRTPPALLVKDFKKPPKVLGEWFTYHTMLVQGSPIGIIIYNHHTRETPAYWALSGVCNHHAY